MDFGKAKKLKSDEDDITSSVEGTYMFLPPECCSFDVDKYSMKKADIWALGVTLYSLTFNHMPFSTKGTELNIMENICNKEISYESRSISEDLKKLLSTMLEKNPAKRASL